MDSFIWIIIIIVVISLISSAAKKNKQKENDRNKDTTEAARPVRPPVMSDIQRAFQLMNDFDSPESQKASVPKQNRPYVHSEGAAYHHEGVTSHEGTHRHGDGATSTEGFHGQTDGRASHEGTHKHRDGTTSREGFRGQTDGRASHEGTRKHGDGRLSHEGMRSAQSALHTTPHQPLQSRVQNKYTNVKIGDYFADDAEQEDALITKGKKIRPQLKLFADQNELVKAVIYSDILQRKSVHR